MYKNMEIVRGIFTIDKRKNHGGNNAWISMILLQRVRTQLPADTAKKY